MVVWISQKWRHKIRHVAEGRASSEQPDSAAQPLNGVALLPPVCLEESQRSFSWNLQPPKAIPFPICIFVLRRRRGAVQREGSGAKWGTASRVNRQENRERAESLVGRENTGTAQQ